MVKWKPSEPNHGTNHSSIMICVAFHLHYNKQCLILRMNMVLMSYPKISGVVYMNRHIGSIDSFYTADCDTLGFVLVLISRFPEGLCRTICKAADHGGPAGCPDVYHTGQVL